MTLPDPLLVELRRTAPEQLAALHGRTVVAGVSGGADSVALLSLLVALAGEMDLQIRVAHLDHALRPESADDARRVEQLAASLGVPCHSAREDVRALARSRKLSIETAARAARYSFLASLAREHGALVAVGHNRDDQAETVLLNLARGAGLRGLRGMRPVGVVDGAPDVPLVRPLLGIGGEELREYCRRNALPVLEDPSNSSLDHSRNRVRRAVLPALRGVNSRAAGHIAEAAAALRAEEAALEDVAGEAFERAATFVGNAVVLDAAALLARPPAIGLRVLRRGLLRALGSLEGMERKHVEALLGLAGGGPGGRALHLPHGVRALSLGGRLLLWRGELDENALYPLPLLAPGGDPPRLQPPWTWAALDNACLLGGEPHGSVLHEHVRLVDAPLELLPPSRDHRFRPLGMGVEKRAAEFLADRKAPRELRHRVPLLAAGGVPVWLIGWRIDDRWRLGEGEAYTCLTVAKEDGS